MQAVAAATVAHQQVHGAQGQRLGLARVVGPAQAATAYDELGLGEEPALHVAVLATAAAKVQAGDQQLAGLGAVHVEFGAVQRQLLKAQVQQGARRQRSLYARQPQRDLALCVKQRDIAQLEGRQGALALDADFAHLDRHAQPLRSALLQQRPVIADPGHNPEMKQAPAQQQ